jgi:hypothetical protein
VSQILHAGLRLASCSNNDRQTSRCSLVLKEPLATGYIFQLKQGVAFRITVPAVLKGEAVRK